MSKYKVTLEDKNIMMYSWTSWYCPIKNCGTIVYNNLDKNLKKEMNKHLKIHELKSL